MRKIVFAALVLFSIIGCGDDDTIGNDTPVTIAFTDIRKGAPEQEPFTSGNFVIRTQDEWDAFTEDTGTTASVPIDFSLYEVIAVVDVRYATSGYAIEITSISKINNTVTVQFKKIAPSEDEGLPAVFTQPLHVVRIQKQGMPVVFEINTPI